MTYVKGQSGNPKGRPPTARSLTTQLVKELERTRPGLDGKSVEGKVLLAQIRVQAALTGKLQLLDGSPRRLNTDQVLTLQNWIFAQVDGPPRAELDVTSKGEALGHDLTDDERTARLVALFESARARRSGSAADDGPDTVAPAGGAAD